eukprot:6196541-Pleurochrysis_carterae.AAC.3
MPCADDGALRWERLSAWQDTPLQGCMHRFLTLKGWGCTAHRDTDSPQHPLMPETNTGRKCELN